MLRIPTPSQITAWRLSRPFWFGKLALLPELGLKGFLGERGVRLDAREQLVISPLVPTFGLGIDYRFDAPAAR